MSSVAVSAEAWLACDGMRQDGLAWDGLGGLGLAQHGHGMGWECMGWEGMGWDGVVPRVVCGWVTMDKLRQLELFFVDCTLRVCWLASGSVPLASHRVLRQRAGLCFGATFPSFWISGTMCCTNEHVVSHECVECPAGTYNLPGDDWSGADTECQGVDQGGPVMNEEC